MAVRDRLLMAGLAAVLLVVMLLARAATTHAGTLNLPGAVYLPSTPATATPIAFGNVLYIPPSGDPPADDPAADPPAAASTGTGWNTGSSWKFCTAPGKGTVWIPSGSGATGMLC